MTSWDQIQYNRFHAHRDWLHIVELKGERPAKWKYKPRVERAYTPIKSDDIPLDKLLEKSPKYRFGYQQEVNA